MKASTTTARSKQRDHDRDADRLGVLAQLALAPGREPLGYQPGSPAEGVAERLPLESLGFHGVAERSQRLFQLGERGRAELLSDIAPVLRDHALGLFEQVCAGLEFLALVRREAQAPADGERRGERQAMPKIPEQALEQSEGHDTGRHALLASRIVERPCQLVGAEPEDETVRGSRRNEEEPEDPEHVAQGFGSIEQGRTPQLDGCLITRPRSAGQRIRVLARPMLDEPELTIAELHEIVDFGRLLAGSGRRTARARAVVEDQEVVARRNVEEGSDR